MVHVIFTHDDKAGKWEVKVSGAKNTKEARQAFTAVVLTCHELNPRLLVNTLVDQDHVGEPDLFHITPAV